MLFGFLFGFPVDAGCDVTLPNHLLPPSLIVRVQEIKRRFAEHARFLQAFTQLRSTSWNQFYLFLYAKGKTFLLIKLEVGGERGVVMGLGKK